MRKNTVPKSWIEITEDLTGYGWEELKQGDALTFRQHGQERSYVIVKKTAKRCWMKPTFLYTPEQAEAEVGISTSEPASSGK